MGTVGATFLGWLRSLKDRALLLLDFSAASGLWLIADRLVRMVTGLVAGALVARYLGPDKYGHLAFALALVLVLQTASNLGLDLVLASELPRPSADANKLLGSSLVLRLAVGMILWLGVVGAMDLWGDASNDQARLVALTSAVLLVQPVDLIDLLFQSRGQIRIAAIPRMVAAVLIALVRLVLVLRGAQLEAFALTYAGEFLLVLLIMLISSREIRSRLHWQADMRCAAALMMKAWPLLFSSLATIVYMRIDQIMLGSMAAPGELGKYAAVLPFSQAWNVIPTALVIGATPTLVRSMESGREDLDRVSLLLFRRMFVGAMVASVLTALLAAPLVGLFLGGRYTSASLVLAVHAFTNVPVFMGVAQTRYLSILGSNKVILFQTLVGGAVALLSNTLLIPPFGALGAAIAANIAMLASALAVNAVLSPHLFGLQMRAISALSMDVR